MATSYNPKIVTDGLILMLDSANPKSWSQNAFEGARDLTSWYVAKRGNNTGTGCTVSQDSTTSRSPANTIPMKMTTSGNDAHIGSYNESKWNISSASTGQTWILSVWIKASVATDCQLYLFGANSSGVSFVDGSWIGISSKLVNVTTQWQRFDHYITFNNANTAYIQFRLDGPQTFTTPVNIWWDGVQIEKAESSTALTDFNPKWNQDYANWYDLSGNGNHGVLSGSSIVYNIAEKAIKFPGVTGNYITVASPNLSTTNHTIIGISRFETSAGYGRIISGNANNWLLGHHYDDYNQYYANTWVSNPGYTSGGEIWRMYTGIGNYTQDYWALYTNGQLIAGNNSGLNGPNGFSLGRFYSTNSQYTPSRINLLMAYDRVLSVAEIKTVYNALRGRYGI